MATDLNDQLFFIFIFFSAVLSTALSALCLLHGFCAFSLILLGVTVMPIEELVFFGGGMVFEHLSQTGALKKLR